MVEEKAVRGPPVERWDRVSEFRRAQELAIQLPTLLVFQN
jgi:hypothetical protein